MPVMSLMTSMAPMQAAGIPIRAMVVCGGPAQSRLWNQVKADVTRLPVDGAGLVAPEDIRRALRPETSLITVMHANNEIGNLLSLKDFFKCFHIRWSSK